MKWRLPAMHDPAMVMLEAALPAAMRQLVALAFDAEDPRVGRDACDMLLSRLLSEAAVQATAALPPATIDLHLEAVRQVQERRQKRLLEVAPTEVEN